MNKFERTLTDNFDMIYFRSQSPSIVENNAIVYLDVFNVLRG